ncbi:hypothetical protein [Actinacidiphila sp. ITFR-21]|uniref:hypothetical protein n=1 Tax=Actinacidiphila sp. ITFR-21 TaxID=3075199 RepID=UPI002889FC39|nr:hypothetical protein [Streptomyces sp. ITFR-21]WNI15654.1 hypothetical protein RLT57_08995 [Streptomyces sp. ITFR-21]
MRRVYRGLLHGVAWVVATAGAATLSWVGVHSVLRSTAYDLPRALPVSTTPPAAATAPPAASSTHSPRPAIPPPPATTTAAAPRPPKTHPAAAIGDVRGYTVRGGRVVLSLTRGAASLVTAVPAAGWRMQVWTESGWLRVTFTSADNSAAGSLFCTWNGHPPSVQTYEN